MSASLGLTPELVAYLAAVNPPEHPVLARCRAETAPLGSVARMQISAEQGALLALLVKLIRAERAFEVGVFTGYSSLTVALALKESEDAAGYLLACDVSAEWTARAQSYWRAADVEEIVDLQLRPAIETLDERLANGEAGRFDFGFIDADKSGYDAYYERGLQLLRPGGLLVFDNMLWSGKVADAGVQDADTATLRALAHKAKADARVHAAMVGVGDGLLLCVKR